MASSQQSYFLKRLADAVEKKIALRKGKGEELLICDRCGHVAHIQYRIVNCVNWHREFAQVRIAVLRKELTKRERREIVKAKLRMNHRKDCLNHLSNAKTS